MVYLVMTSTIVEELEKIQSLERRVGKRPKPQLQGHGTETSPVNGVSTDTLEGGLSSKMGHQESHGVEAEAESRGDSIGSVAVKNDQINEPSLSNPQLGNPVSHGQLLDISSQLKAQGLSPRSLDVLLRGSRVYVPPPSPKPEPTSEYKSLMARLRRDEEARSYQRMTNPLPAMETFAQRFPMSSAAHAFPTHQDPEPEDEVTYADINRQIAMIANVLLSIVACAGAIWVAARWWSTPARLALSMSGSLLVGVAEVVVYGGYIKRVREAKGKEKGVQEIKEIIRTWVVGGGEEEPQESVLVEGKDNLEIKTRRRKKAVK